MNITKTKLCGILFFQFVSNGAVIPIISYYMLEHLHFSPSQAGIVLSISAFSLFVSPLIISVIADKIISTEKLIIICSLLSALFTSLVFFQKSFSSFTFFYFLSTLASSPNIGLAVTMIFHQLEEKSEKEFGFIRVWGTIGWIVPAWMISFIFLSENFAYKINMNISVIFFISSVSSIISAFITMSLPKAKIQNDKNKPGISLKVIFSHIFKKPILFIFIMSLLINFFDRFYILGTSPFLASLEYPEKDIMAYISFGQIAEIFFTIILGTLLIKYGTKNVIIMGFIAELIRYGLYAFTDNHYLILISLAVHGATYALLYLPFIIELNKYNDRENRAGVQQLYSVFMYGIGSTIGNYIAGLSGDILYDKAAKAIIFEKYWLIPLGGMIVLFVIFLFMFKRYNKKPEVEIMYEKIDM